MRRAAPMATRVGREGWGRVGNTGRTTKMRRKEKDVVGVIGVLTAAPSRLIGHSEVTGRRRLDGGLRLSSHTVRTTSNLRRLRRFSVVVTTTSVLFLP